MKIIIDTHLFLWLAATPEKLSPKQMKIVENLDNTLYLSSISIAEMMIKRSIGQLDFDADILALVEEMGIELLDFDAASAVLLATLPFYHRDPFDRMIIAQSIVHGYKILTVDRKFAHYECALL